jgi:hypothetical protein
VAQLMQTISHHKLSLQKEGDDDACSVRIREINQGKGKMDNPSVNFV